MNDPDCFYKVCAEVLNRHAPQKKKYVRGNSKPFMNKTLSQAIMQRTKLRNKFLKDPTEDNKISYTKQRNWCVSLLRKEKKEYFANLNEKDIIDNKNFWQTVKPFLSEKLKSREKITLVEKEELVSSESDVAQRFNQFFSNIVKSLDIPKYAVGDTLHLNLKNHPTLAAILKYRDDPSIITIKRFRYQTVPFHFSYIDKKTVLEILRSLSKNKASQETDMPVRVVKENAEYFAKIICSQFNESINSSKFPLSFKIANITPVFKNESRNHKNNYRPVSILPLISKVFEKIMNKQLSIYFEVILSKFQCGFRKGFSTQHCLLLMLEKWKRAVDNNKVFGALLTDLSEAFDCISHDLLIAKLNAYGLSLSTLKLVHSYLQNRKQRTKIGSSYSLWEKIVSGVPQGSILGSLLFNIFLCDFFLSIEINYFTNYADDTTPYVIGNNPDEVVSELRDITEKLFTWFSQNEMKTNLGKCHMLLSSRELLNFQISETIIHNSQSKKLLGVTFDNKLKFEKHINRKLTEN